MNLLDRAVELATRAAAGGEARVSITAGRDANTRFARSEATSNGDVTATTVRFEVAFGKRHAQCSTNQHDEESLRACAEQAARLARISPEDGEWMPVLPAQKYIAVPQAHDADVERMGATERAAAVRACLAAGDKAGLETSGLLQHSNEEWMLGTSAGLRASHRSTSLSFSTTARTPDGSGSGWAGAVHHQAAGVQAAALARVAMDKAKKSARPRKLEPGRYTVILEAPAVASLMGFLAGSMDARRADEGRSFFAGRGGGTRIGEKIWGPGITLRSDPADPSAPSAPFDSQGVPLRATTWIDRGVVTELHWSRYWASRVGREPTGWHGAWTLSPGTASTADLLKGVKRGVLVTRFWYLRWVDPQSLLVTGLTRDGVFLVENGVVTHPVNNFRFNDSPDAMLRNADLLGREVMRVPDANVRAPALRTHDFNLASVSDAV